MNNFTDVDLEVAKIMYRQGLTWGKNLTRMVDNGKLDPNTSFNLKLAIGNIDVTNFSYKTRLILALGSPRAIMTGNSMIIGAGLYTGGTSLMGYKATTNPAAKTCYGLSALFSGSAITTGGMAVAANSCRISTPAAISESCAVAFMFLGKQAHVSALYLEGKPIPPHLQGYIRKGFEQPFGVNNGLSFVMPRGTNPIIWSQVIEQIPFEKIGRIVGISLTVYGYTKIAITTYRYGQQLFTKWKKTRNRNNGLVASKHKRNNALFSNRLNSRVRSIKIQLLALWVVSRLTSSTYCKSISTGLYKV